MKQLRVAGVKLEFTDRNAPVPYVRVTELETGTWICLPVAERRLRPTQARRISRWFADLAEELEGK